MEQMKTQWLGIALIASLWLGYFIGKLRPRIIERIIFVREDFAGRVGDSTTTCKTCQEGESHDSE